MEKRGINGLFHTHGFLCASHPVEVLLLCITGTVCLLTLSIYDATHAETGDGTLVTTTQNGKVPLPTGIHVHVSTTSYFLALLCIFLQCKKLLNTGSKYLVGIVSMFSVFSCMVYTSIVGNIFGGELVVLREALPFFFLLNDFTAVGALTKFALLSKSYEEAPSKIAQGISTLGPSVTLNTLVGALVIGVGTLSGVEELETASDFGCLALLTHYLIFMTFLPACLSLFLELCDRGSSQPHWQQEFTADQSVDVHEHVPSNPLLQQVKLIMSAGLTFVHVHSRLIRPDQSTLANGVPHPSNGEDWLSRFLAVNAEHVLAIVLALLVATKYLYLEKDDGAQLLEPPDLEKHKSTRSQSTPATFTYHKKDFLNIKQTVTRRRRSTFTIGDEAILNNELNQIHEELNHDVSIDKSLQLQVPCSLKTRNASVELIPPKEKEIGGKEEEKQANKSSPIRRTLSFTCQRSRSKSMVRKNVVAPICDFLKSNEASIEKIDPPKPLAKDNNVTQKLTDSEQNTVASGCRVSESINPVTVSVPSRQSLLASGSVNTGISKNAKYSGETRSLEECKRIMKESDGIFSLTDDEICSLVEHRVIPGYQLESTLNDLTRAVSIRRKVTTRKINRRDDVLSELPYHHFDYTRVSGACCENVIGYMPVPVGVAGPLLLDGRQYYVPMATTEGCLVASTNRGCSALMKSGGVRSSVIGNGMTRGPVCRLPSAMQASEIKLWLEDEYNFQEIKGVFDSTSRFARLTSIKCAVAGRLLFARFLATTGDAMGMNMLSKGTEKALHYLQDRFQTMEIMSLSGNYCTDKKATALNWIEGRGKSVVSEAIVPGHVVTKVLKTSVTALTELNHSKNLVGSAMAGAIGGFNAHAANIVTALFIATGQDPAQNVASSNCITLLEPCGPTHEDLYISCTMPSIEVGTIGGGTVLTPQASCLQMLGVQGANKVEPGQNAAQLARIVCGTVLAGELSLLSALAAGHLVRSHLKHNRSTINLLGGDEAAKNCAVL